MSHGVAESILRVLFFCSFSIMRKTGGIVGELLLCPVVVLGVRGRAIYSVSHSQELEFCCGLRKVSRADLVWMRCEYVNFFVW